jgi:hypothetical protein
MSKIFVWNNENTLKNYRTGMVVVSTGSRSRYRCRGLAGMLEFTGALAKACDRLEAHHRQQALIVSKLCSTIRVRSVAQLVEQKISNLRVADSSSAGTTSLRASPNGDGTRFRIWNNGWFDSTRAHQFSAVIKPCESGDSESQSSLRMNS